MDQNPESLNRSIAESLRKINGARRMRAGMTLALGSVLFLYSFLPVFLSAKAGDGPIPHRRVVGALSILAMGMGLIQFVLGPRARLIFEKQIRPSTQRTFIFYGLLIGLLFLADFLVTELLVFLGHQLAGQTG